MWESWECGGPSPSSSQAGVQADVQSSSPSRPKGPTDNRAQEVSQPQQPSPGSPPLPEHAPQAPRTGTLSRGPRGRVLLGRHTGQLGTRSPRMCAILSPSQELDAPSQAGPRAAPRPPVPAQPLNPAPSQQCWQKEQGPQGCRPRLVLSPCTQRPGRNCPRPQPEPCSSPTPKARGALRTGLAHLCLCDLCPARLPSGPLSVLWRLGDDLSPAHARPRPSCPDTAVPTIRAHRL